MKIRKRTYRSGRVSYQVNVGTVVVNGEKKRRQPSFKTKQEAENERARLMAEKARHGSSALEITVAERHRFAMAQTRLADANATIEEATDFYLRHASRRRHTATLTELVRVWKDAKSRAGRDQDYLRDVQRLADAFAKSKHLIETPVHQIPRETIESWLFGQKWKPKTVSIYLINLTTLFQWGTEHGYLSFNPCAGIEEPALEDKPPRILTVAECKALLEAALVTHAPSDPCIPRLELLGYIAVCLLAGVRPEETAELLWSDFDLPDRIISIRGEIAKRVRGPRRRIAPITPQLAAWLKPIADKNGRVTPQGLAKRRRKLCQLAKVEYSHDVTRHSFASYDLASHGDAGITAGRLGHSNSRMLFKHYREVVRPREAASFHALLPPTGTALKKVEKTASEFCRKHRITNQLGGRRANAHRILPRATSRAHNE